MRKPILFVLLLILMALSACRAKAPAAIAKSEVNPTLDSVTMVQEIYNTFKTNQFKASYFLGKFDGVYHSEDKSQSFNGQLRIQEDSVIWASVYALMNIEIFRILIRPDSFFMLNKLEKTYTAESTSYLNQKFDLQIDFEMLQAVLFGNDFPYYETDVFKLSDNQNAFQLSTLGRRKLKKYVQNNDQLNRILIQTLTIDKQNYKLLKQNAKIIGQDKAKLRVNYSNFIDVQGQLFPSSIIIFLKDDDKTYLEIKFNSIETGEVQTFPFKVPAKYTTIKIKE